MGTAAVRGRVGRHRGDLITSLMQRVFAEMDPGALVAESGLDLSDEDRVTVANMIDTAIVEIEVGFPRPRDGALVPLVSEFS